MATDYDLNTVSREDAGTSHSRRMRRDGMVPAVVYGAGKDSVKVSISHNELLKKLNNEAFLNSILNIAVDGKEESVLIKDIQVHPARRQVMHLDLQRVRSDVAIKVSVPLAFINDDIAVGVKLGGGTVTPLMNEVEISCLPKNLPERLEVDVEALELDDMLYLEDIVLPQGVEISLLTQEEPANEPIVAVRLLQIQEEEPEVEELAEDEEGVEAAADGEEGSESAESEGESEDSKEE
jgi:large subunit ribosomal protein L25